MSNKKIVEWNKTNAEVEKQMLNGIKRKSELKNECSIE